MEQSWWRFILKNGAEIIAALFATFFTILVFLQVMFRYCFKSPISWAEELTMLTFQWCVFLGAAIAVRHGIHFKLDFLTRHFSTKIKFCAEIFSSLIIAIVALTMVLKGWNMVLLTKNSLFATFKLSRGIAYAAIPVSGILIMIYLIPIFMKQINLKENNKK
jgi:TRAP-type C4-dicarboxylate transport system permease small subunit